ncbi:MAG: spore germination protein [Clostridia bacterium]|nr:spore germination protein [Clostridia bacterium]
MNIKSYLKKILTYNEPNQYNYNLSQTQISNNLIPENKINDKISNNLQENIDYLTVKYNILINSDIASRSLNINLKGKQYSAFILYIDGMVDSNIVNSSILKPLMLKNRTNTDTDTNKIVNNEKDLNKVKSNNLNIKDLIYNSLLPQNSIKVSKDFEEVITYINSGFTILLVDTISEAYCIEAKGYKTRNISSPMNEVVIRGPQEAFVEDLRTNTSMIRRIVNNENLIIEQTTVGNVNKTKVGICYMSNITNEDLVNEVKYRINNLDIDAITSSGHLEHLIQDSDSTLFPQVLATERSDRTCNNLLQGRVAILVDGAPTALIVPAVFIDFLASPEDSNLKYQYSNLVKLIRGIAFFIAVFLPGFYAAITTYHQELIPSDLIFAISAGRTRNSFPCII